MGTHRPLEWLALLVYIWACGLSFYAVLKYVFDAIS
jgi:hypothetical protein